jgi:uncharacterized YccA/Bax inhibitor family protein
MRSGNPTLGAKVFEDARSLEWKGEVMTLNGTVAKTGILTVLLLAAAGAAWMTFTTSPALVLPVMLVGAIGGFITAMITIFNKQASPITAPIYAVFEGLALGGISAITDHSYPGIAIQAVGLTAATLAALLFAYTSGLIKATENFKLGVVAATGGIAIYYLIAIVLGLFHIHAPMIYDSGPIGIGFSAFIVLIAALNLVLDFDFIEQGAQSNAPKFMEWYGAFGLMVTLVWLYLEILRLLSKANRK